MKQLKKGFTLIEILVVIGIIAILAAIVLIAINPARQFAQANNSQRTSNVNAILNAIGQFMADNQGEEPTDVDAGELTEALCDDLVPTYLPALPTDPRSSYDGAAIDDCNDLSAVDGDGNLDNGESGYEVTQDANGRITVTAPEAELSETIEVTR
jgi:prepilin-type N-terminal cleavage/methylation domain-containing protein